MDRTRRFNARRSKAPFLSLPSEVRRHVYSYLSDAFRKDDLAIATSNYRRERLAILRTCHFMYNEARRVFYNAIFLTPSLKPQSTDYWSLQPTKMMTHGGIRPLYKNCTQSIATMVQHVVIRSCYLANDDAFSVGLCDRTYALDAAVLMPSLDMQNSVELEDLTQSLVHFKSLRSLNLGRLIPLPATLAGHTFDEKTTTPIKQLQQMPTLEAVRLEWGWEFEEWWAEPGPKLAVALASSKWEMRRDEWGTSEARAKQWVSMSLQDQERSNRVQVVKMARRGTGWFR